MKKLTTNLFFNIKKILIFILLVVPFTLNATTYYVKSNGSDSNTGLSDAQAWKTISKVNSSFSSFVAGSSVLFNKGDIFTGTLTISKSGSSGNPITIGSYGSGANPIITGFTTISNWTNEGGGIYSKVVSTASSPEVLVINGVQYSLGRYPKSGTYLYIDSHSGTTSITDADLNSATTNWTGAELVMRTADWCFQRNNITGHSSHTLTYTAKSFSNEPTDMWGYFIQNDLKTLTQYGDWCYKSGTLYVYFASDPSALIVQLSTINNVICTNTNISYITLDGLSITGGNNDGLYGAGGSNITIQNCDFSFIGLIGIEPATSNYMTINNCTFQYCNDFAVLSNSDYLTITNNTFNHIGNFEGHGCSLNFSKSSVTAIQGANLFDFEHNIILNSGYCGIATGCSNAIVRYNFINTYCTVATDGAGIYIADGTGTFGPFTIDHNIILNGIGAIGGESIGTSNGADCAIYVDEETAGYTYITNNSMSGGNVGIKLHACANKTITGNTAYDYAEVLHFQETSSSQDYIRNVIMNNNKFIAKASTQLVMWIRTNNTTANFNQFGTFNNNYYARPIADNTVFEPCISDWSATLVNLANWKSISGQDANSSANLGGSITSVSQLHFVYNETNSPKLYSLSVAMKDVTNASYSGTISLPSWTSLVLIGTGTVTEGGTTNSIDFYIDPTGSNSNDGSSAHPWLTLAYACAHTISGNIIHVNAGTYIETTQCSLAVGVSIEGSGVTSIIQSTVSTTDVATLLFDSPNQGTNGNQHISNLKMDGVSLTGQMAIRVNRRSNVIIHDITFNNFMHNAIYLQGGIFGSEPTTYATGNQIYNCIITNCAGYYNSNGYGNIDFSGQDGLLLHDNNINQTARTGLNGYCTKAVGGYNRGVKIYNNTVTKAEEYPAPFYIIMEFWDVTGGIEIYGNTITGGYIDCGGNFGIKRTYSYTYDIHNNTFALQGYPSGGYWVHGIGIEGSQSDVIVRNNSFTNFTIPICLTQNGTNIIQNIYIYYNIFKSISSATGGNAGVYLYNTSASASNDHIYILNNVFYNGTVPTAASGVRIQTACPNTNIYIENNIFQGLTDGGYVWLQSGSVNGLTIQNNIAYGNGNSNNPLNTVTPTNYTYVAAIKSLPSFVTAGTDFHLQGTSPAINAGVHITTPTILTDYDGNTINNPPEIGAYEYSGSVLTTPIVTTTAITSILQTTATSGGNITSDGGASVTARGICWNTSINPTIANSRTSDSTGTGVFTSSITGLIANTVYHIRAYATNNTGTAYGVDVQFTTLVASVVPTVTATTVMNITETTATFGGNVNSDGNSPVTARGVCWSVQPNPIVTSSHTTDGTGTGVFVSSITGLMSNTLYHVRAYATNAIGTAYSTDISFTTLLTIVAPTVLTTAIMNITSTTAVGGGNVTADGNSPVFGRGICWSTIVNPTTNDNSISDVSGGLGTYLLNVLNLISNTLYHVRAYATNAVGTIYGNDVTFTTLITPVVLPTVTTTVIGMITQTTAISGGNVTSDGGGVTVRGVCWSKVSNPTIANSFTNDGTGTGIYISTLTGLIQNTTYHIRAYATNSAGTSYGTDISFTTLNSFITVPTVSSTTPVTNIAKTTVTSGGNISTDGGAPVTARGVCWAATINPTIANSKTSDGTGIGVFVSNMTGMTKSTNYHVRAYATNSVGTAYGNDIAFKTDDVPTVITTAITNKLSTSVTTGGNVTNDDSIPVTARGICWSKTINPIVDNLHTVDGVGLGKYVSQITGLIPNTTYHVRAYATNSAGTAYGSDISFTTLNIITNSWIINPNPAKTYFTIKLVSGVLPSYVKIYNMNDKLVLQKYIGNGVTSIVINIHLNIGKYVVCLDNKIINSSWKQLKTNIILFVQ